MIKLSILRMILVQAKGQEKTVLKELPVFILMPIASTPISNIIVYQHLIATLNNKPIEEVKLEAREIHL